MAVTMTSPNMLRFFLIASAVLQSHTEQRLADDSGFISIDCGITTSSYEDDNGVLYTSDNKYINTGINFHISTPWKLVNTIRSFPKGLRNCYNLSLLNPNNLYLIRARFMYGNYDGTNTVPEFDVYVGVNFWFTFKPANVGDRLIKEIIHVATAESLDVCLVNTGHGILFISALELRPLDNSSYPASPAFSLALWYREDIGGIAEGKGRYSMKDDVYDRLWYRSPTWPDWEVNSTNESLDASQANPSKVPSTVLLTAGEQHNGFVNLNNQYTVEDGISKNQVYAYWYFVELELLVSNDTREFNIFVPHGPGYKFGPVTPKYLQLTTIASPRMSLNGSGADAVAAIKDKYQVPRIWQGDPCLPANYQWDGLNCTYVGNTPPTITSLSLSSSNLTGDLPPSLSNLTSLLYLNLSNNAFTGKIPAFLAHLSSLHVIDLTGNNLTGPVPRELAEKASNKSIVLRLDGNLDVCNSYPCDRKEKMEINKKRHHFIVPMVTTVASVSLLLIIGIIFLAMIKRRKKRGSVEGLVDGAIKPKNKQFKSSDIVRITDNFRKILGKGGFGTVYYGVLQDGTEVAVKVLNNTSSTITLKQFCAEAELLTRIHHVNLVLLIGYCDERANMALVYEYMSCGNLQMHLSARNEDPLSWKARLQVSIDAAQGLEYLHSGCRPPIIHRDVKPANILLDQMGHAKIADFGLSRFFTTLSQGASVWTDLAGTRGYLDPEYCQMNTLSEKSDVYAFGIVLLQLLTEQPALIKNTNDEDDTIHIIDWVLPMIESGDILAIVDKRLQGDLIVNSAWKFLEIATECVKPRGNNRPRMTEVVVDLQVCYASEGFLEQNAADGVDNETDYMNSNRVLDSSPVSPSAR